MATNILFIVDIILQCLLLLLFVLFFIQEIKKYKDEK